MLTGIDIQSELHQTKRRFTDFVFQRVQVRKDGSGGGGLPPSTGGDGSGSGNGTKTGTVPEPARQRVLRTPRSVSSLIVAKSGNRTGTSPGAAGTAGTAGTGGVPLVRATSPGAEIREEKRLAAQRKEKEERLRKAVYESPSVSASASASPASPVATRDRDRDRDSPVSPGKPIRRFQISRTSTTAPMNLHRSFDGGVQKRKGAGGDGVAVLVEKLRKTHSRQASQDVFGTELDAAGAGSSSTGVEEAVAEAARAESRPRKRPVVNQAEKKWREERKNAISAAKDNISNAMDRSARARGGKDSTWDDESDRLAGEFERIALELDGPATSPGPSQTPPRPKQPSPSKPSPSPSPLKYQPRIPNKPRSATKPNDTPANPEKDGTDTETDSEDDYVYDVYVRRPLTQAQIHAQAQAQAQTKTPTESQSLLQPPSQPQFQSQSLPTNLKNPLAELETQNALLSANVGVIVITQEDEIYWENFIEDEDDEEWDSEDADSNGFFFVPSPCLSFPVYLSKMFLC